MQLRTLRLHLTQTLQKLFAEQFILPRLSCTACFETLRASRTR
jgi:hypothetical protein